MLDPTPSPSRRWSLSYVRWHQCGRKFRHATEADALDTQAALYRKNGSVVRVYQCQWCAGWHVGRNQEWKPDGNTSTT